MTPGYDDVGGGGPEGDEVAGYRPISSLAVAALAAGACSAAVLLTPLAAAVPLVAAVLALVALADIRRAAGRKAGRPAALIGLALALGFAAQAAADAAVTRWIVRRRAVAAATAWIEAVRAGRLADAVTITSPLAISLPGRDPAGTEPAASDLVAGLEALPAVAAVRGCETRRPEVMAAAPHDEGWTVRIDLAPCGRADTVLRLEVEARVERGALERWKVTSMTLEP